MTIKVKNENEFDYSKSEVHLKKQQDIDTILVLSKILDVSSGASPELMTKAQSKISQLIDKL